MTPEKLALIKRIACELADAGESAAETADLAMYVFGAALGAANKSPKDVAQYIIRLTAMLKIKLADLDNELPGVMCLWEEFEAWEKLYPRLKGVSDGH
jgi:hypothetical protein